MLSSKNVPSEFWAELEDAMNEANIGWMHMYNLQTYAVKVKRHICKPADFEGIISYIALLEHRATEFLSKLRRLNGTIIYMHQKINVPNSMSAIVDVAVRHIANYFNVRSATTKKKYFVGDILDYSAARVMYFAILDIDKAFLELKNFRRSIEWLRY